jgi:DNA-binding IclR family transcriptional regulator
VARDLQAASLLELTAVANDLGMTAYLSRLDGGDCITLVSAEPLNQSATIAYKPGARHPITAGADGVAMQLQLPESQLRALLGDQPPRPAVAQARQRGYASSSGEVVRGISAVAVPLVVPGHAPSALAVVYVESEWPVERIGQRLVAAAASVRSQLT